MLRATTIVRRAAAATAPIADTVTLDHDSRHRRRVAMRSDHGTEFLLDLEKAVVLGDGDAIQLGDGRLLQVRAAAERLVEITAPTPARLMKIAWHIGNRHTPAELGEAALWIKEDHVLIDMVRNLGGAARIVERPFTPERGAYDQEGANIHRHAAHGHHDHHDHDHGHDDHHHGHHDHHHG